ncbi:MAG: hypothetical protein ABIR67_01040 [Gaiellaceae bacterium]
MSSRSVEIWSAALLLDHRLLVLGAQPNETFEHAFARLDETP